jgi:hypothetical protein
MARILNKLLNIFIILVLFHEGAENSPFGFMVLIETIIFITFLSIVILTKCRELNAEFLNIMSVMNTKMMCIFLPTLIACETVICLVMIYLQAFNIEYNMHQYKFLFSTTIYIISVVYGDLDEYDYYQRSLRCLVVWILNWLALINYCNRKGSRDKLNLILANFYFKVAMSMFAFSCIVLKVFKVLKYRAEEKALKNKV